MMLPPGEFDGMIPEPFLLPAYLKVSLYDSLINPLIAALNRRATDHYTATAIR